MNAKILFNSPDFDQPKPELEQYSTPVDIVAEIMNLASAQGHLSGTVVDLGCGTGRLAIGAALLGTEITAYEIDNSALELAKEYAEENNLDIVWVNLAIDNINKKGENIFLKYQLG